ncbi:conjugal transfer protein TrbH [Nitrosomonas halophila]|uniref:Conjugal transfer protein TrbH n=1 Tax=Nitrosomonas halophila TaxID=44576 RepID=A0A1H3KGX4_9PROT|nr:conjugal transfer protein TrbH [Nitrosomonas halophila]SDY51346.1 Conjugal transfer protein TrbH [Nitrosomonas halophila]
MRKIIIASLFALSLAGCATTGKYGNFVPAAANQQQIASDAVQQLATLYPPAKTRFELQQATPDAFGIALINSLRERGYALLEFNPVNQAQASIATAALPLRYVLDQAGPAGLYRLTLLVGSQSITRPYLKENGSFVPAGYWVRKE